METLQAGKKTKIIFLIFIIFFVVLQSYPVFWVLIASLKTPEEIAGSAPYALPGSFYLGNYIKAFTQSSLVRYFLNSVVVAICTLFGIVVLSAPAAYAISKIRFKQSEKVLTFFLLGMMIPTFSCLIPMFQTYNTLGLRNTYAAVILPQIGFSLPMCIFLYVGFMKYIPNELLEASKLDGCDDFQYFFHIVLPLSTTVISVIALYYAVAHWNSYFNAFLYLSDRKLYPLQIFLRQILVQNNFDTSEVTDPELAQQLQGLNEVLKYSIIVVSSAPLMCLYPFVQKHFVKGVMIGSVKG